MAYRILIVEDEMTIAFMIEDMLISLGHEVVEIAMRLPEALEVARRVEADLAILDVNLDGLRSFPVAEVLDERGIPFGFATGYGAMGVEERFRQHPILKKPFRLVDLETLIEQIVVPG
ncbi:response regulator [Novosphingobium rosa]|uniref:response regulator n=1 Tax=Novosphingobium rosa TaxID=76978 RepID=UPI0008344A96|nr:response regulator [Novosphingobium rosa]